MPERTRPGHDFGASYCRIWQGKPYPLGANKGLEVSGSDPGDADHHLTPRPRFVRMRRLRKSAPIQATQPGAPAFTATLAVQIFPIDPHIKTAA